MTSRERFLAAAYAQKTDRRPIWLMRQAGRYLPEYRALREKHGFLEMVKTPELAAEVTLQPLRRYALDAAILFSDILTIPEALGIPYAFREGGGIAMQGKIENAHDVKKLQPEDVTGRLGYVYDALRLTRAALRDTALLGFCGAPWTLAAYLVQGGSAEGFPRLLALAREDKKTLHLLLEKLAVAAAAHLRAQIAAGADAVQIFDSWAGICPAEDYAENSLRWVKQIIEQLPKGTPVIFFAKGAKDTAALWDSGAQVLGFGSEADLPAIAKSTPQGKAVQGNLGNALLLESPEKTAAAARALL